MDKETDAHLCLYIREGNHEFHADIILEGGVSLRDVLPQVIATIFDNLSPTTH